MIFGEPCYDGLCLRERCLRSKEKGLQDWIGDEIFYRHVLGGTKFAKSWDVCLKIVLVNFLRIG